MVVSGHALDDVLQGNDSQRTALRPRRLAQEQQVSPSSLEVVERLEQRAAKLKKQRISESVTTLVKASSRDGRKWRTLRAWPLVRWTAGTWTRATRPRGCRAAAGETERYEDGLDESREDSEGEEREGKEIPRRTFLMSSIPTKALLLSGLCTGTRENPLSLHDYNQKRHVSRPNGLAGGT